MAANKRPKSLPAALLPFAKLLRASMAQVSRFKVQATHFFQKEIWKPDYLKGRSWRNRLYALLRVISITIRGLMETKVASRAAALSFSSLLGLGPLVAIAVLVAGFVLDRQDPALAVHTLNRLIRFIAPQVSLSEQADVPPDQRSDVLRAINMQNGGQGTATPSTSTTPSTGTAEAQPATPAARQTTATAAPMPPSPADDAGANPTVTTPPANAPPTAGPAGADGGDVAVNPELVELIDGFIAGSKSSTAGAIGVITLIAIVLQLFTSIENTFNDIWGVRRGRSWVMRIVFYWTVITLGAVLFFAAVTTLSAGAYITFFEEHVPWGGKLLGLLQWSLPSLSVLLFAVVLTLFYRFIPNTHVWWRAAFAGALVVAALVVANNFLAFLYLSSVIRQKSLFGSLGILPILMAGLYVFWFFVLLGGQVSYAVQNVHFRNSRAVWNSLAESARERLSLIVLLMICRRFHECLPPCTATQLSDTLRVPTNILNEALNRLGRMGLVTPIPPAPGADAADYRFQPARPLNRITFADFKRGDDDLGDDPSGPVLTDTDPLVARYDIELGGMVTSHFFTRSIEDHFRDSPNDTSRPPFAFGQRLEHKPRATNEEGDEESPERS